VKVAHPTASAFQGRSRKVAPEVFVEKFKGSAAARWGERGDRRAPAWGSRELHAGAANFIKGFKDGRSVARRLFGAAVVKVAARARRRLRGLYLAQ
jgi:hypothetical protein